MRTPEQEKLIRILTGWNRRQLAARYRRVSGHVGSPVPPEQWSRDDLINEILRAEYHQSPAPAVTNPVPQADAVAAQQCAAPAPRNPKEQS